MESTLSLVDKMHLVKKQTVFSKLTEDEIIELASLFQIKAFQPGETIVTEGDFVDSFFLIVEGSAEVQHITLQNGQLNKQILAELHQGQAIGLNETGFYSLTGKRTATVVALTQIILLELGIPKFHGFALAYPHVNEIMRQNADRKFE